MPKDNNNRKSEFNQLAKLKSLQVTTYNFPKDAFQFDPSKAEIKAEFTDKSGNSRHLFGCYYPTPSNGTYEIVFHETANGQDSIAHLIGQETTGDMRLVLDEKYDFGCDLKFERAHGDPRQDGGKIEFTQKGTPYPTLSQ